MQIGLLVLMGLCFLPASAEAVDSLRFPMSSLSIPRGFQVARAERFLNGVTELIHTKSGERFFLTHQVMGRRSQKNQTQFDGKGDCQASGKGQIKWITKYNQAKDICTFKERSSGREIAAVKTLQLGNVQGVFQLLNVTLSTEQDKGLSTEAALDLIQSLGRLKVER